MLLVITSEEAKTIVQKGDAIRVYTSRSRISQDIRPYRFLILQTKEEVERLSDIVGRYLRTKRQHRTGLREIRAEFWKFLEEYAELRPFPSPDDLLVLYEDGIWVDTVEACRAYEQIFQEKPGQEQDGFYLELP